MTYAIVVNRFSWRAEKMAVVRDTAKPFSSNGLDSYIEPTENTSVFGEGKNPHFRPLLAPVETVFGAAIHTAAAGKRLLAIRNGTFWG